MPFTRESDNVEDIEKGTYVYWTEMDDDVPRGALGEVIELKDDRRRVKFAQGEWDLRAVKLNVCDIQRKSFVHVISKDVSPEAIGEVKDLEDGKLRVEILGEEKLYLRKYLIRCDFQPGMFCFWTRSDDDIPSDHMGRVLEDVNDEGRVKVKFPNGAWRFPPHQLVRAHIQPGAYVQWTRDDEDIEKGEVGKVVADLNDEGKCKVQFAKGTWRFRPEELFCNELQMGCFVTWEKHDEDIAKGDVGYVVGIRVEKGRLKVHFPKGTWNFKCNELRLYSIQPGDYVTWKKADEDIPRGDIGEVVRTKDDKNCFRVQWRQGCWSMKPKELVKTFQLGDRVHWVKESEKLPKGHIGQIIGLRYSEEDPTQLYVRFPNGRWGFTPDELTSLNLENDGINELKATFKRFDKNGDGKLSQEELFAVLGKLGEGAGGLSEDDCNQLFDALDKDGNGKLTTDEFLDYIFGTEAAGSTKKLLGDGFGFDAHFGLGEESDEEDDNDDDPNSGGGGQQVVDAHVDFNVVTSAEDVEGIDASTTVSKAEWCSAMLTVGICRAAALESFDGCLKDVGKEDGELSLEELAGELNGIGHGAGVEELRSAVGKVKHGKVPLVDLEKPAAESPYEVELATKSGLDGLLFHLQVQKKGLDEAAEELPKANLTELEAKVLSELEDLPAALAEAQKSPATLSAVSSWQRARESCRRQVQAIIDQCKESGEKFVDKSWDPNEDENFVMYVDKEKPGWDCGAHKPYYWKRAKEVYPDGQLVIGTCEANDVEQGSIGDCFFVGAVAALAANRPRFIRQAFVHYDMDVGVYGVLLLIESHFVFEIIDDVIGVRNTTPNKLPEYARSQTVGEFWIMMIEKAFFKHHTCLEMCDGGQGTEAMYCFMGGVTGRFQVAFDHPAKYFNAITEALAAGELMVCSFTKPSKGKYAGEGGEDGRCGEKGLPFGLYANHCYSVLRTAELEGNMLLQIRNPWGKGEWTGPWGDKDEERWTDSMKEAVGQQKKIDGCFWMAVEDYVQVVHNTRFLKTFGPTWQCAVMRGRFAEGLDKARAKTSYQGASNDEFSFKKGDIIEVTESQGYWCKGTLEKNGASGFFRSKDVELRMRNVFKYTLSVEDMAENTNLIFAIMVENQLMRREWQKRKEDGMNVKNKQQPTGRIFLVDKKGEKIRKKLTGRHVWRRLKPENAPFEIYMSSASGKGMRYSMCGFAPHGKLHWEQEEISYNDFLDKVG